MAETLPSVSCLVSPRNGDAPLSLETSSGTATLSRVTFNINVGDHGTYRMYVMTPMLLWKTGKTNTGLILQLCLWCGQRCRSEVIKKGLTTCLPPVPAARSWLSLELKIENNKHWNTENTETLQENEQNLLPTNSGVPKMFLNSVPASILCASPKSMSLMRGSAMFLSRSIMFSGCGAQRATHAGKLSSAKFEKHNSTVTEQQRWRSPELPG